MLIMLDYRALALMNSCIGCQYHDIVNLYGFYFIEVLLSMLKAKKLIKSLTYRNYCVFF